MLSNRSMLAATAVLAALLLGNAPTFAQVPNNPPIEYKLAAIQSGGYVDPNDPLVAQFGSVLNDLEGKCQESRNQLSGISIIVHNDMAQRGVDESYLSILQHVDASIPDDLVNSGGAQKCADIFAAYAVLRLDGGQ